MLPPERLPMPAQWRDLLAELAPVFARRSTHRLFMALACGLILADRGTVTGMAAAVGIGRQWRRACWFFASAKWDPDALGLAVARLIVKYLLKEGDPLVVAVDGTLFRRWGRRVAEARWAYDGAAQGGKKIAFGNYADPPVMPTSAQRPCSRVCPGRCRRHNRGFWLRGSRGIPGAGLGAGSVSACCRAGRSSRLLPASAACRRGCRPVCW